MTSKSNSLSLSSKDTPDYAVEHDFEGDQLLSTTVISAVADSAGVQPLELPPLYETIDPDTLDSLFRPSTGDGPDHISFTHVGYAVTVYGDGTVVVEDAPQ